MILKISIATGDFVITDWLQAAWNLTDPNQHGIFAPASGMAVPPDGSAGYNLIKAYIAENGAPTVFNSTLVMDYSYTGKTWIGYDDRQSITTKVLYAKRKGLLGSMSIGLFQMQLHAHGEHRDTTFPTRR
ncbi:unnamed protein product [Prunus armeniaca]|uniref:GH18 domain-containing protein n=1 Tax=Prunus armeniaca TaxID=36596 RepID=A0A6J5Y6P8_PRUAR|nr:unnamed protein product [Prunus armeniaca]